MPCYVNNSGGPRSLATKRLLDINNLKFQRHSQVSPKMSNYNPAYPNNVQVDAGVKEFITKFYGVSDTPGKNQEWLDFFHDDATLVMALQEATGKTGALQTTAPTRYGTEKPLC